MGEDVGRTGGVFRVTDGLHQRYGADRVIDTPVAESAIVGVGFGMAVGGMRPVLELQFMGFSYPALRPNQSIMWPGSETGPDTALPPRW